VRYLAAEADADRIEDQRRRREERRRRRAERGVRDEDRQPPKETRR
jgi:hypothetical protein